MYQRKLQTKNFQKTGDGVGGVDGDGVVGWLAGRMWNPHWIYACNGKTNIHSGTIQPNFRVKYIST